MVESTKHYRMNNMNPLNRFKHKCDSIGLGLGLWCVTPRQQYFTYIVAVSFICGRNRTTRKKPQTCRKLL